MAQFLIYSSIVVLLLSKVALILYLFMVFYGKDLKENEQLRRFAKNRVRKIIMPKQNKMSIREEIARYVLRLKTLLWTVVIGEIIGYIFLALSGIETAYNVLSFNATILFMAAFTCQLMNLVDAWIKKKINIKIRVGFEFGLVILATLLVAIAGNKGIINMQILVTAVILAFYASTVLALYSMLIEALFNQEKYPPYDFNNYSRLVILFGIIIGGSLTLLIPLIS